MIGKLTIRKLRKKVAGRALLAIPRSPKKLGAEGRREGKRGRGAAEKLDIR